MLFHNYFHLPFRSDRALYCARGGLMLSGGLAAYKRACDKRFSFLFRSPPFAFSPKEQGKPTENENGDIFFPTRPPARASKRNETKLPYAPLAGSLASTAIFLSFSSRSIGYSPPSRQPAVTRSPPPSRSSFFAFYPRAGFTDRSPKPR